MKKNKLGSRKLIMTALAIIVTGVLWSTVLGETKPAICREYVYGTQRVIGLCISLAGVFLGVMVLLWGDPDA